MLRYSGHLLPMCSHLIDKVLSVVTLKPLCSFYSTPGRHIFIFSKKNISYIGLTRIFFWKNLHRACACKLLILLVPGAGVEKDMQRAVIA